MFMPLVQTNFRFYHIGSWRRWCQTKDLTNPHSAAPVLPDAAYFTLAPDWLCEVLSPSTRKLDLGGKSAVYARAGVRYIWFVDPIARSLETKVLRGGKWAVIATLHDDATVSLPPFEEISFSLDDLWLPPTVHKAAPGESTAEPETAPIAASR